MNRSEIETAVHDAITSGDAGPLVDLILSLHERLEALESRHREEDASEADYADQLSPPRR